MREVSSIIGGIGLIIVLTVVLKNAGPFGQITNSIATSSSTLIGTLTGSGSGFGSSAPVTMA